MIVSRNHTEVLQISSGQSSTIRQLFLYGGDYKIARMEHAGRCSKNVEPG